MFTLAVKKNPYEYERDLMATVPYYLYIYYFRTSPAQNSFYSCVYEAIHFQFFRHSFCNMAGRSAQ